MNEDNEVKVRKARKPRTVIGQPPEATKTVVRISGGGQRVDPIVVYGSVDDVRSAVIAALEQAF